MNLVKKIIIVLFMVILLLLGIFLFYHKKTKTINEIEAQNIVLKDIGVKLSLAKNLMTKKEIEDGKQIYEIKLTIDNTEYEYEISATDGTILKRKKEQINGANNSEKVTISFEKAWQVVLNDSKLKKEDIEIISEKSEIENGIMIYEIEFYNGENKENKYEYEIDLATGVIVKKEVEQRKKIENSNFIGEQKAFDIAIAHANVSDVTMKKIKLDYEHGTNIYEIEFYKNGLEYEYEIDAHTGAILKYSQDRD